MENCEFSVRLPSVTCLLIAEDDFGDGFFGEEPADQLNNGGDLAWAPLPLVDEDLVEMSIVIKEK